MPKTNPRITLFPLIFSALSAFITGNASGQSCNTWLKTTNKEDVVTIGDLDIPGDKITVEAIFNRTEPLGIDLSGGDLVSKHSGAADCNYLLRANRAEITTTNGFVVAPADCGLELNRTYHSAFVYDGTSLKFYRNGFLMKSVPASGNLILNNWLTTIGDYAAGSSGLQENLQGYINEVRIWNVARTQQQIRDYMSISLPSPTTQVGLKAYYIFDGLENKQGNSAWDGATEYNAVINETNPACPNFVADSCAIIPNSKTLGGIINNYTPAIHFDICTNTLLVDNASSYNIGDTVLLIQMKGAIIDSTNTPSFGTIEDYNNAGNFEFNIVELKTGNRITLKNKLLKQYDFIKGKVQLIRVPYYENVTITTPLTCLPWNGSIGGVLAFNVQKQLTLNNNITVAGRGYLKGSLLNSALVTCDETGYFYPGNTNQAAHKGEGINILSEEKNYGRGASSNGGGGGNGHNCGGGGGANAGEGGHGGDQWEGCDNITENVGGKGGKALANTAIINKVFMGGSGGTGQGNSGGEYPAGNGGGIIIISANTLTNNGNAINASGENASPCNPGPCGDGMSGGGAGGTILLDITTLTDNATINANGGNGADHISTGNFKHGPGGGGGGGFFAIKQPVFSPLYNFNLTGGINGVNTGFGNDAHGATAGSNGKIINSFDFAIASDLFKKNIDSVRIQNNIITCGQYDFRGLGYINDSPINQWEWSFGDNKTATTQNAVHSYTTAGTYIIKLVVTDANSCTDSTITNITLYLTPITSISNDTTICYNSPIQLNATGGIKYSWSPAIGLDDASSPNPIASTNQNITYKVLIADINNCQAEEDVTLTVHPYPAFTASTDQIICGAKETQLIASGGDNYLWSPTVMLNDPTSSQPVTVPNKTTDYSVYISENTCGFDTTINMKIEVINEPALNAISNAFTPNGDGKNDCFGIQRWGNAQIAQFAVYNRWGQIVFQTKDPSKCWDGTFNGRKQDAGGYVYVIKATTICGAVFKKGIVTLVR